MPIALQHSQICAPWADCFKILMGQNARDLVNMCEVMDRPGGQKLRERGREPFPGSDKRGLH